MKMPAPNSQLKTEHDWLRTRAWRIFTCAKEIFVNGGGGGVSVSTKVDML